MLSRAEILRSRPREAHLDPWSLLVVRRANETVDRYAAAMLAGDLFPPIDVVVCYDPLLVRGGAHRVAACRRLGRPVLAKLDYARPLYPLVSPTLAPGATCRRCAVAPPVWVIDPCRRPSWVCDPCLTAGDER